MTPEQSRTEFEAWLRPYRHPARFERDTVDGGYIDELIDLAYKAWQAARQPSSAAEPVAQWQPISTAPKNGRESLFRTVESGQVVMFWNEFADDPWWANGFDDTRLTPTHWQPLPAPPLPSEGSGNG